MTDAEAAEVLRDIKLAFDDGRSFRRLNDGEITAIRHAITRLEAESVEAMVYSDCGAHGVDWPSADDRTQAVVDGWPEGTRVRITRADDARPLWRTCCD